MSLPLTKTGKAQVIGTIGYEVYKKNTWLAGGEYLLEKEDWNMAWLKEIAGDDRGFVQIERPAKKFGRAAVVDGMSYGAVITLAVRCDGDEQVMENVARYLNDFAENLEHEFMPKIEADAMRGFKEGSPS